MNEYRKLELARKTNKKKEEYKYFVGTTLKNPLEYKVGEKVTVKLLIPVKENSLPHLRQGVFYEVGVQLAFPCEKFRLFATGMLRVILPSVTLTETE